MGGREGRGGWGEGKVERGEVRVERVGRGEEEKGGMERVAVGWGVKAVEGEVAAGAGEEVGVGEGVGVNRPCRCKEVGEGQEAWEGMEGVWVVEAVRAVRAAWEGKEGGGEMVKGEGAEATVEGAGLEVAGGHPVVQVVWGDLGAVVGMGVVERVGKEVVVRGTASLSAIEYVLRDWHCMCHSRFRIPHRSIRL